MSKVNYQYDKKSDTIYHKETVYSYPSGPVAEYNKVDYSSQELNTLREAILADRFNDSDFSKINPLLKRNNAKNVIDNKYECIKYELMTIYQNLLAEQLSGVDIYCGNELDLPLDLGGLGYRYFELWERPLSNLFSHFSYEETLEVANHLVNYLKEQENWDIENIVTEDGIMKLYRDENRPWVK